MYNLFIPIYKLNKSTSMKVKIQIEILLIQIIILDLFFDFGERNPT